MAPSVGAELERWSVVLVVVERDGSLVLHAEPTRTAVPCPVCGTLSNRQHSKYQRRPLDLPWRGAIVRMNVHTRRCLPGHVKVALAHFVCSDHERA
jgi:hypothetical protein